MATGILTRIRNALIGAPVDAVQVRFLNGPLAGRTVPVARKYLGTGVYCNEEDLIFDSHGRSMHMGWSSALGYDFKYVSRLHYRFDFQDDEWRACLD